MTVTEVTLEVGYGRVGLILCIVWCVVWCEYIRCDVVCFGLVYWGLTPQQQPGSYQGGEMMMAMMMMTMMMMMKSVFWWRKPEYPEETTDLR